MSDLIAISPNVKRVVIGIALTTIVSASTIIGWRLSHATATPPAAAPNAQTPDAATGAAAATAAGPGASAAPAEPLPTTVQIVFTTVPSTHAIVTWGKTILGRITPHAPLVVVRPRDSGPLDVIVRAAGYMPVHTRAHTFADTKIGVKLTRPDQKPTLFGYRAPLDAGMPDAGPGPLQSTPTTATTTTTTTTTTGVGVQQPQQQQPAP